MRAVIREVPPVALTLRSVPHADGLAYSSQPHTTRRTATVTPIVASHARLTKGWTGTVEGTSLHVWKTQVAPFAFVARQAAS